jgi:hypothetical protein
MRGRDKGKPVQQRGRGRKAKHGNSKEQERKRSLSLAPVLLFNTYSSYPNVIES